MFFGLEQHEARVVQSLSSGHEALLLPWTKEEVLAWDLGVAQEAEVRGQKRVLSRASSSEKRPSTGQGQSQTRVDV